MSTLGFPIVHRPTPRPAFPAPPPDPVGYRVYGNGGTGGPVDYGTVLADQTTTGWVGPVLDAGSDWTFGVHCYSVSGGQEELNVSAVWRVRLDASGLDVTGIPAAPSGLTVQAMRAGQARVRFAFDPGRSPPPTGFAVFVGTPSVDYSSARAVIPYYRGMRLYATGPDHAPGGLDVQGLLDGVVYQIAVRAFNTTGHELNTLTVPVTGDTNGPGPVDPVSALVVP